MIRLLFAGVLGLSGGCGEAPSEPLEEGIVASHETDADDPVNPLAPPPSDLPPANPLAPAGERPPTNPLAPTETPSDPVDTKPGNPLAPDETSTTPPAESGGAAAQGFGSSETRPIEIGRTLTGPLRMSAPSVGMTMELPAGWRAQAPGTLPLMVVTTPENSELLTLVWAQRPAGIDTVRQLLSEALDLGNGSSLRFGPVRLSGDRVSADVTASSGTTGRVEGMVSQGRAVLVMTIPDSAGGKPVGNRLLGSVRWSTPSAGTWAEQVDRLRQLLGGTRLERRVSESGDGVFISNASTWDFCSDGSFAYAETGMTSVSGSVATDTGSGTDAISGFSGSGESGGDQLRGRWRLDAVGSIAGEYLQVTLTESGRVRMVPILPTDTGVDFMGLSWNAYESARCN